LPNLFLSVSALVQGSVQALVLDSVLVQASALDSALALEQVLSTGHRRHNYPLHLRMKADRFGLVFSFQLYSFVLQH